MFVSSIVPHLNYNQQTPVCYDERLSKVHGACYPLKSSSHVISDPQLHTYLTLFIKICSIDVCKDMLITN